MGLSCWLACLVGAAWVGWLVRANRSLRRRLANGQLTGGYMTVSCRLCGRTDLLKLKPDNNAREFLTRLLTVTRECRMGRCRKNLLEGK